jgi:group I intron endonuclease
LKSGVYQIRNVINNKRYVGSSIDVEERWAKHKWLLKKGRHSNIHLQRAWNKDGESSFEFSAIEFVNKEELITKEQYYTDLWRPEYAIRKECVTSSLGCKHSVETKQKISNAFIGKSLSDETKRRMSIAKLGCTAWNKGKMLAEGHRQNISKSLVGNTRTLGKRFTFSEEHKAKLRRPKSEETKKRMTEAKKKWWAERKIAA